MAGIAFLRKLLMKQAVKKSAQASGIANELTSTKSSENSGDWDLPYSYDSRNPHHKL